MTPFCEGGGLLPTIFTRGPVQFYLYSFLPLFSSESTSEPIFRHELDRRRLIKNKERKRTEIQKELVISSRSRLDEDKERDGEERQEELVDFAEERSDPLQSFNLHRLHVHQLPQVFCSFIHSRLAFLFYILRWVSSSRSKNDQSKNDQSKNDQSKNNPSNFLHSFG